MNIPEFPISLSISRRMVASILAAIFALAFLISPYWEMFGAKSSGFIILIVTAGMGIAWSYLSAADIKTQVDRPGIILLAASFIMLVILNYRTLTSVIPLRGDEAHHIMTTTGLMERAPVYFTLPAFCIFILLLYAVHRKLYGLAFISIALEACVVVIFFKQAPFQGVPPDFLLRYPFINYWFFASLPGIANLFTNPYLEIFYRLIPLLSTVLLIWVFQRGIHQESSFIKLLWGLSAATMPVIFYYSSILYLELPAVFLMTVVCLNARELLHDDIEQIKHNPAWLALILIGFIKETALIFLLGFLFCRFILLSKRLTWTTGGRPGTMAARYLAGESGIQFCVLFPALLYVILRTILTSVRGFTPNLSNLADLSLYKTIGWSFLEQFGPYVLLFSGGWILLTRKKDYATALLLVFVLATIPLFHAMDARTYVGYSRFNLFAAAPILAGSLLLINKIERWGKDLSALMACLAIGINLVISPINLDGTKIPYWGNYFVDTSEHYYPYDQALPWLRDNYGSEKILFSLTGYEYYFDFYFSKLDWFPDHEVSFIVFEKNGAGTLANMLSQARAEGFGVVVFHLKEMDVPKLPNLMGYCLVKVFRNQAHALAIFHQSSSCTKGME